MAQITRQGDPFVRAFGCHFGAMVVSPEGFGFVGSEITDREIKQALMAMLSSHCSKRQSSKACTLVIIAQCDHGLMWRELSINGKCKSSMNGSVHGPGTV